MLAWDVVDMARLRMRARGGKRRIEDRRSLELQLSCDFRPWGKCHAYFVILAVIFTNACVFDPGFANLFALDYLSLSPER
jgi:hypothetical protein